MELLEQVRLLIDELIKLHGKYKNEFPSYQRFYGLIEGYILSVHSKKDDVTLHCTIESKDKKIRVINHSGEAVIVVITDLIIRNKISIAELERIIFESL